MKVKDCVDFVQNTITEEEANLLLQYAKQFKRQSEVKELYSQFREDRDLKDKELKLFALLYCIIKHGDYRVLFEDQDGFDMTRIHVVNKHGHRCRLDSILEMKSHAILICATLINEQQPVIVKYYRKGEKDVKEESSYYAKMREAGAELPWCSTTFTLFGQPILVLEKLEPLCKEDNEFQMGTDILTQLQILHKRVGTCHSDLKLGNVMKISGVNRYSVIDFGGCPRERSGKGWLRRCHTPLVTSQKRGLHGQIMTEWHDLMELCYTMKMIQNLRDKRTACQKDDKTDYVRTGFEGLLKTCVDFVKSLDKYSIQDTHYDHFRSILKSGF